MLPVVLVSYDIGAASPVKIAAAARRVCDVVFLADRARPHVADQYENLLQVGRVVDITGLTRADIIAAVSEMNPAGVVSFSEFQQSLVSDLVEALGLRGNSPATVHLLTDKLRQRQCLADAGVQSTCSAAITSLQEIEAAALRVGFPAVLKPRRGSGSVHTYLVNSLEECAIRVREVSGTGVVDFVLEELLVGDTSGPGAGWGDYVSVESVVQNGEAQTVCVTGKHPLAEPFRETGDILPSTLEDSLAAEVVSLERAALTALGVQDGVYHTEVKLTAEGPRIIEVNGRMAGYVGDLLMRAAGLDLTRVALEVALGKPVSVNDVTFDRFTYQRFVIPPAGSHTVVSLDPLQTLSEISGVQRVEVRTQVGEKLDWRDGTQGMLAIVYGSASCPEEVLAFISAAEIAAAESCM
ncbi:ATP-grasp domain-containing protein [Streptomyces sp. NPDC046727]|uniref:ATP-grasp domain-containing protein n=1 Tax=Streptomyces sp. NPDC046727 TaxID=3155373 RepID=UPI0033D78139